jgi:hypothetical protein
MTLKQDELLKRNLTGFKFAIGEHRMTMTSRSAYETDPYVVLQDDGENCIVADLGNHTRTRTWDRRKVAKCIETIPLLRWDAQLKANVNDIDAAVVKDRVDSINAIIDDLQYDVAYYISTDSPHRAVKSKESVDHLKDEVNQLINENLPV